ncbi:glycoside hydrolase [Flagelloscypha sp. PMI_526]|nr:glycoside hydrolase [Flagelloscypha sp. PMI_526]
MWIMELKDEWNDAVTEVANATFSQSSSEYAPFFETVIRYLGGVLSAYSLSGDSRLLRPAEDLGSGLLKALNTSTGLPMFAVQLKTGFTRQGWISDVLYSEAMSCQLEYKFLAHVTGKEEFYHPVEHIMQVIEDSNTPDSAYPTRWSHVTGQPTNQEFSVGAFADSGHEYLLKQYLMSSKSEPRALRMYLKSMNAIIDKLLYVTPNRGLLYVTDTLGVLASHKFEHLSCFLPGLLALGAVTLDLSPKDLERHTWAARGLAYTCYITYADQATGLGPDEVTMTPFAPNREEGLWVKQLALWEKAGRRGQVPGLNEGLLVKESGKRDYNIRTDGWFLRPEAIEAMFYMWKTTGEVVWRERGWEMFLAIEKFAKTEHGYASLRSVDILSPALKDESPSYFYAETLKYLYLMFREDDLIPLDQFVFNTEAHPLHVFEWTKREKEAYKLN